jgi:hypothetical protein
MVGRVVRLKFIPLLASVSGCRSQERLGKIAQTAPRSTHSRGVSPSTSHLMGCAVDLQRESHGCLFVAGDATGRYGQRRPAACIDRRVSLTDERE